MKRFVIFIHRYLGIPMSVIFVVWFVSGIVMMYTGDMPALSESARLSGLGPIDFDRVSLAPAEAAARAELEGGVASATLSSRLGRPLWSLGRPFGRQTTVFADNGDVFDGASRDQGRAEVARFLAQPIDRVRFIETVAEADQWTITQARSLPLERFDVDDGKGTRAYFSLSSGEVELITTSGTRTLAWVGAIPHWFYFTPLRTNQPLWYWTVVWVSVLGCGLAVLGLILAFTQFRRSRPFRLSASIRYRGWMRWHYYTGALFGLFALTWVFSGLMSMEPFEWTRTEGMNLPPNELEGGPLDLDRYRLTDSGAAAVLAAAAPAEITLIGIQGEPHYRFRADSGELHLLHAGSLERTVDPVDPASILAELERTVAGAGIVDHDVLEDYDAYYYSQSGAAPLPALRVKFDDSAETWYYFDLMTSEAVYANHRLGRIERWLFNGLHSLDFGFWYGRRPLWDIGVILLSIGALATSGIGAYLGWRRMFGRATREPAAGLG